METFSVLFVVALFVIAMLFGFFPLSAMALTIALFAFLFLGPDDPSDPDYTPA